MLFIFIILLVIFLLLLSVDNHKQENFSIIKPYIRNYRYYGIKQEIHPLQMIGLLNFLKTKYPPSSSYKFERQIPGDKLYYNRTKLWIVNLISKVACGMAKDDDINEITDVNELLDIQEFKKFRFIQNKEPFTIYYDKLQNYYENFNGNTKTFKFILKINRRYADIGYTIYFDITHEPIGDKYYINNYEVLGTEFEDEIKISSMNKPLDSRCSLIDINHKNDCNTVISYDENYEQKVNDFKEQARLSAAMNEEDKLYACFGKDALTEAECISYELIKRVGSTETNKSNPGIWAKIKCTTNEECPYYRSNQNYPNTRGGCIDGKCEMPIGVSNATPTIPNPDDIPLCHNCNRSNCSGINCFKCCDEQLDKTMYPNLTTPDYAFDNDINERLENESEFVDSGYSSFKLIR